MHSGDPIVHCHTVPGTVWLWMIRRPSYCPILNPQTFNMFEVFAVVGDYGQVFGFSCATDKEVEVFNLLARFPKFCSFLGKDMEGFIKSNNLHLRNELLHLPEVFFNLITIICTKDKLSNDDIGDVAFVVLAARISSTMSSAERLSFHTPAKRLAQPVRGLAAGSSGCVMELLSKVMSSNFTLSLKSFNSDQYLALMGDGVTNAFVFICSSYLYVRRCKNRHKFWNDKIKTEKTIYKY